MIEYIKQLSLIKKYLFITLILHLISVYFSVGFYKDDEHFQILEPIAYLLNVNNVILKDNGYWYWEWEYAMRPWSQSHIYYLLIKICKYFNLNDPFLWSFVLRLFSSIIGLFSIFYLFQTFKKLFNVKDNHFNYIIFFTFWFYPFLHSRTSSENLGISFFIISFCFLYKSVTDQSNRTYLKYNLFFGLLLGLSMVFRLNLIFTILPILLWTLIFNFNLKKIFTISLGVSVAMIFGALVDIFSYKYFTISYYNFFYWNIIWGRMADFGHQPWWFYPSSILLDLAPLVSVYFVLGLIFYWLKKPLSMFTWLTIFTIFIISLFSHKEIRYVFPIYIFAPFFIIYLFEYFKGSVWVNPSKYLVIFSNIIFLLLTLFTPANGKIAVLKYINTQTIEENDLFYLDINPYLINEMEPFFYTHALPSISKYQKNIEVSSDLHKGWFVTNNYNKFKLLSSEQNCKKKYNTFPENLINLNPNWKNLKLNWYVLYCK